MNQQIQSRVIAVIAKTQKILDESISLNQSLDELCEDSLDLVTLLFALEDEFNLDITDNAKESKTVLDIVTGIEHLLKIQKATEVGTV